MKLSFRNGNIFQVLTIVIVYVFSIWVIPYFFARQFPNMINETRILLLMILNMIAIIVSFIYLSKNTINNIEKNQWSVLKSVGVGVLGFFVIAILQMTLSLIMMVLSKIFGFDYVSENTQMISQIIKSYPLFIIMPVVFAPILEELVFRKAIFGYFYDILKGSNKVIQFLISSILAGIIFALPHDGFSPIMIIYIIMSLVFSGMYLLTKRIITPMIAHFLMNLTVMGIQLFLT